MAGERGVSPERHAELMAQFGFDRPLWQQYLDYLGGLLHGDFGYSFSTKKPVLERVHGALSRRRSSSPSAPSSSPPSSASPPASSPRSSAARWFDQLDHGHGARRLLHADLLVGLLLIILFSGHLGWTPVSGRISLTQFFPPRHRLHADRQPARRQAGRLLVGACSHLILPTIVLGTIPLAVIARQTRSAMLEVLGEDYVRTARAKGLSPRRVVGCTRCATR